MKVEQGDLFAPTAGPVRSTDPATSGETAAITSRQVLRIRVLNALALYGAMTDERIAEVLEEQKRKDSVTKRRGELVDAGLVRHAVNPHTYARMYGTTTRGSRSMMWECTPTGLEMAVTE